jgi:hypothetical protein
MRVFGFNDELDVMTLDLPDKQVAEFGIDAWRLDLYDKDPLLLSVECSDQKGELYFRKLRDISFSYKKGKTTFVGVHDGVQPFCFSYLPKNPTNIKMSNRPFSEHYLNFLKTGEEGEEGSLFKTLRPSPARAVTLRGNTVHWDEHVKRLPFQLEPIFVGESLSEKIMPVKLPDSVSWIFEMFGAVEPILAGEAVIKVLSGDQPSELEVYVKKDKLKLAKELLTQHPVGGYYKGHKNAKASYAGVCSVYGHTQTVYVIAVEQDSVIDAVRSENGPASMYGLYCANDHEVRGTRLQFLNLSKQQQR